MSTEYVWVLGGTWARRHLAREGDLSYGLAPGRSGRSVCGRPVADEQRAVHAWKAMRPNWAPPKMDEVVPCDVCARVTGVVVIMQQDAGLTPTAARYARQVGRYEMELRQDDSLLRQVMETFKQDHDLTGRSTTHAECDICRLLKRVRRRLASPDRVGVGT